MKLTPEQIDDFEQNGCLVISNFLDAKVVKTLNMEIERLYTTFDIDKHPITKFTTEKNGQHIGNKYFLRSSDKISFFFEPDAFDSNGRLTKPIQKSVNKIGHGLHILDKEFRSITINPDISQICKQLNFKDPRALQSMIIIKQPGIGNEVPPHTDSEFLYTDPVTCLGFWFALENCTTNNGCLQFIAGSHKMHNLEKRFVRDSEMGRTKFVRVKQPSEDWNPTEDDVKEEEFWQDSSKYTNVQVPAGSLVLIHGNLVHKSERNNSQTSRNAYVFHVVEAKSNYDELNWLQIPFDNPSGTDNFCKIYEDI